MTKSEYETQYMAIRQLLGPWRSKNGRFLSKFHVFLCLKLCIFLWRRVARIKPYRTTLYANKDDFCFYEISGARWRIFVTANILKAGISCLYFGSHRRNIRPRAMKLEPQLDFCLRIPASQKFWKSDHYWLNYSILTKNKL